MGEGRLVGWVEVGIGGGEVDERMIGESDTVSVKVVDGSAEANVVISIAFNRAAGFGL